VLTDSQARMKEMMHQVKADATAINRWTKIGYAVDKVDVTVLDGLNLPAVCRIRNRGICDNIRKLMSDIYSEIPDAESCPTSTVGDFELELKAKISEAQKEWSSIDVDLLKVAGSEAFIGTGLAVVAGSATILPALAVAGAMGVNLAMAHYQRKNFLKYYPAGAYIDKIRKAAT
jgi:hypothetical protein